MGRGDKTAVQPSSQKGSEPITSAEVHWQSCSAICLMYSAQRKKWHFKCKPFFTQSSNFELRIDWLNATPKTGGEVHPTAISFWSRVCNPASWLHLTGGFWRPAQPYPCSVHHRITLQHWQEGDVYSEAFLWKLLSSSALQHRRPSTAYSSQGPYHNWSAGRTKVQYPGQWFNVYSLRNWKQNPLFPLLPAIGKSITWFIWGWLKNSCLFFFLKSNFDLLEW